MAAPNFDAAALLPRPRRMYPVPGAANPPPRAADLPPQGYRITVDGTGAAVESADAAGNFYAQQTMAQLRRMCGDDLPRGVIEDWPDFPIRGVMLDISRDKVPTMETLYGLIDLFAGLKLNRLELYMEHTFAYRNHAEVWADASPMTAAEVRALDAYCRDRFIELVPNQNTFGHMHRWLKHPRYRELAECPDGYVTPWDERRTEPPSLNPLDPRSIALVRELLAELLPNFSSRSVNVGCDETLDLGLGRSKSECQRVGKGRVYLDYVLNVYEIVQSHGHTMHFWGDIILNHPELIPELPRDAVPLVWGYEANHPFDQQCAEFARAGLTFFVCPGTSAWNSIAGRTDNCLKNLLSAAESGLKHGARGYLVTDWGDNGHWQPLHVSYPGYAAGAALSWCLETNRAADWPRVLDAHVFLDTGGVMGRMTCDFGNAYLQTGRMLHNASALFRLLHQNDIQKLCEEIGDERLDATARMIAETLRDLALARMKRPDGPQLQQEAALVARMLMHACARALGRDEPDKSELAADMTRLLGDFRKNWLVRNRPGGLSDSTSRLQQRLIEYTA